MALSLLAGLPTARGGLTPGPTPSAATILRVGELQQPDSLNPFVGVESTSYIIWAHVYELLVGIGPDESPIPSLAKDWSVDATQKIWTFHLQNNVTWQDGVPFTSEDVNFTFRYIYPQTPLNSIGCNLALLQSYIGDYQKRIGVDVGNISTPDPYTIVMPTYQPKANMLAMFVQILPKHIWSSISCNNVLHVNPTPMIGTGMYKFTAWQKGAYVQLDLNQNYWRLDKSKVSDYVQTILISFYSNAATMYGDFTSGAIDATDALTAQQFLLLQAAGPVGGGTSPNVGFYAVPGTSMSEMGACVASDALINQYGVKGGRSWLVTNQTIRQAMQLAVNRSFLVDNILGDGTVGSGLGTPGSTIIPAGTPFWHLNITKANALDSRIDRARQLLDDPKGDGYTLKAGTTSPGDYGQNLDPAAPNNADAFAAINPSYPNVRVPVNPAQVGTGDVWGATGGASAPNTAAPYPLSFGLDVINTDQSGSDAADSMIQWWAQIGVQVTKSLISESKMISVTYACSEDFYLWGWGMDVDPDFALSVMTTQQILYWQDAWYSNKTYDNEYVLQQTQVDPYARQQTIWAMQNKLYYDAPYLVVWYYDTLTVVRTDTFTGWTTLGDWAQHPGLGLTGYGNDLVMLTVRVGGAAPPPNNCPTVPTVSPAGPITVFEGANTTFSATSSDPDAGQTLTWTWNWDDGNVTQNRTATGSSVSILQTYRWARNGTYNVTLTVNDGICPKVAAPVQVTVVPVPTNLGWIEGMVTDAATHAALASVSILATPGNYQATTNAAGHYNLSAPAGTYTVTASLRLYASSSVPNVVVADGATTTQDLALSSVAGWISGTVTATGGGPLAGAALYGMNGSLEYSATTDAQGRYNMTVAAGIYTVNATLTGYYTKQVTGKQVLSAQTTTVDFALDPVPQPSPGLSPLVIAGIAVGVLAVIIVAVALLVSRRRKKAEEIEGPPLPPPKQPGTP